MNLPEKYTPKTLAKPSKLKTKERVKQLKEQESIHIDHIKQDWKKLKSDLKTLAVVAGSAYVAYRVTKYLLKPSASNKELIHSDTSSPKKTKEKSEQKNSPIMDTIKTKLVLYAFDFVKRKIEEQFSSTK